MSVVEPHLTLVIAGAAISGAALYMCWIRTRGVPPGRRSLLLGLRAVLFALVLIAVLNPRLERQQQTEEMPLVLVAIDASRSMTELPLEGESRYASGYRAAAEGDLARALRSVRVESYLVADGAQRVEEFPLEPEGASRTDLRRSLSEVFRTHRAQRPVACVLISDGADGAHLPPARISQALRGYGVPIYCIGVGSPDPVPDVSIPGLVAPTTVTEGEQFDLRALVRTAGLEDEAVELSVTLAGRTVASRRLEAGATERSARFELTAGAPGYHRYTVTAPPASREATLANNRRSVVVRVEPAEARLLLIEGTARREYAFLRRLLLRIEDLDITILLRKADPAEFWFDHDEPRRAGLADAGDLSRYRAVILSNVDARALGAAFVTRLAEYVSGGGTLAMLGGPDAFGAGGWAGTPVGDALPVRMTSGDGLLADPLSMQLSGSSDLSAALRESGVREWGRLPLLEGMNATAGVKAGAEAAMQGITGGATLGPVLITGRHGAGRSLAVSVDDTWRWRQSPSADEYSRTAWEAFWTGTVGWLIVPRADRQVVIEVGRESWESGEAVRADVHVADAEMEPVAGARVTLTARSADGERVLEAEATPDPGIYRAIWRAGEPGPVRLTASAARGGEAFGQDQRDLEITEPVGELTHAARPEVLEAIADATGGRYLPVERAADLTEHLPLDPETAVRTIRLQPARTLTFFLIVVLIAGADWLLRRRWGVG